MMAEKRSKKPLGESPRKPHRKRPPAIHWAKLGSKDQKRLLHQVARWLVEDQLNHAQIAPKVTEWVKKNRSDCYTGGMVLPNFVGRLVTAAAHRKPSPLLQPSRLHEEDLARDVFARLPITPADLNLVVAPDGEELLRYAWQDIERVLRNKVRETGDGGRAVVGVSGGRTMLRLAASATVFDDSIWEYELNASERKRIIICSLTSGGTRTNIAALSDTVAAIMAQHLGTEACGLLGPAWFADPQALRAFCADAGVREHFKLVHRAEVILTSVGYLGDNSNLMRQLLDEHGQTQFAEIQPDLADLLYNCYDGQTGTPVEMPAGIAGHMLTTINLEQLQKKVKTGIRCIALAVGREKGYHVLPGLLRKRMVSDVYMDRACAEGLRERLTQP